jgi:hypothetical protein
VQSGEVSLEDLAKEAEKLSELDLTFSGKEVRIQVAHRHDEVKRLAILISQPGGREAERAGFHFVRRARRLAEILNLGKS